MIDIFIPSYHRPNNIKTAKYFIEKIGYDPKKIHVVIDDATDDIEDYQKEVERLDCNLHIFNMDESIIDISTQMSCVICFDEDLEEEQVYLG